MAHDGQATQPSLADLRALLFAAQAPLMALRQTAVQRLRAMVTQEGRVSAALLEQHQRAAHGLAWLATYIEALRQIQAWAERLADSGRFGEMEGLIARIGAGEYLAQIAGGIPMNQGEILRPADLGLTRADLAAFDSAPSPRSSPPTPPPRAPVWWRLCATMPGVRVSAQRGSMMNWK